MGKLYLPHSEQFDLMNENLAKIANALALNIDLSTWAGIQKAVRVGVAPDLIPVGTQLKVSHSVYGDMLYDVVAHNHFKSAYDKNAHTMTLMCHDAIITTQFDGPEAFYYADTALPSGTYNFTLATAHSSWVAGTYQFTLQNGLPQGGQLCINNNADIQLTSRQVVAFASRTSGEVTESAPITLGNGGTSLGTFGVELNHPQRITYGSNNYKESAVRQFLNKSATAGSVWTPQTKFDRPPTWQTSLAGFVGGLGEDFLSVIGEVIVPCATNNTYESPDSTTIKGEKYTVKDKFYLASQREIFGTSSDSVEDDSNLFPYYESATNTDRIKYRNSVAVRWWTRSPFSQRAYYNRSVYLDGSMYNYNVGDIIGVVPVCTIV